MAFPCRHSFRDKSITRWLGRYSFEAPCHRVWFTLLPGSVSAGPPCGNSESRPNRGVSRPSVNGYEDLLYVRVLHRGPDVVCTYDRGPRDEREVSHLPAWTRGGLLAPANRRPSSRRRRTSLILCTSGEKHYHIFGVIPLCAQKW